MNKKYKQIIKEFGADRVRADEPMSEHTHIKIGGPADLFMEAKTRDDLIKSVQLAIKLDVPFLVLGWASNTLVSDKGYRGFVIQNRWEEYEILEEISVSEEKAIVEEEEDARQVEWDKSLIYDFRDLDYTETDVPEVLVNVSSGYGLPKFIIQTLNGGLTGLQWFAGIPGTVAGAVYNNIHGGKKLFDSYVHGATIIDGETGELHEVSYDYFGFGYDKSSMHENNDILVDIILKLKRGNVEKAKWVRTEWAKRKSVQPQNSLGCTFANPPLEVSEKMGYPTPSVGYFVEHVMGWEDHREGGAGMGRDYGHAAFIVNDENATAEDYRKIMDIVSKRYKEETGYDLRSEIFFAGEF